MAIRLLILVALAFGFLLQPTSSRALGVHHLVMMGSTGLGIACGHYKTKAPCIATAAVLIFSLISSGHAAEPDEAEWAALKNELAPAIPVLGEEHLREAYLRAKNTGQVSEVSQALEAGPSWER